jgi:NADH-quinone oxidoreductase subunit L
VTHAFFKALLFLGSGSVIHAMHHAYHATHSHEDAQDMRNMGGLRRYMPDLRANDHCHAAIAGIPPLSGFFSKDEILAFAWGRGEHEAVWKVFWAMGALGALLTAFYMARLLAMTFLGENRTGAKEREHLHEAPWIMTGPLLVLGVLTVIGGAINFPEFWPTGPHHLLDRWLEPVVEPAAAFLKVELPHGPTEMALIALAVAIGIVGLGLGRSGDPAPADRYRARCARRVRLWKVINRKWYVDEIYDEFVVRPHPALHQRPLEDRRSENHRWGRGQRLGLALARSRQAGQPAPDR